MLYTEINFPFEDIIKRHTLEVFKNAAHNGSTETEEVFLPEDELGLINDWFQSRNVSPISKILAFRRSKVTYGYNESHIDGSYYLTRNANLVVPVAGTIGSKQYWYDGPYRSEITKTTSGHNYQRLFWSSPGKIIGEAEILKSTIVKVNIPHHAVSNGKELRITATIRFSKNENIEYLSKNLS